MMVGLTLVLSILCIFIASIIRKIPKTELDIVAVNDIAKTVEEQWEFLNIQNGYNKSDNNTTYGFLNAMSDKYEMDFSLVDVEDKLLFTTREAIT